MTARHEEPGVWRRWWAGLALAAFVAVVAGVVVASGRGGPSEASDQDKYHEPVIDAMVEQWPAIDVVNYSSATSPGYHALMAGVRVLLGEEAGELGVRALNALFGAMVPLVCFLIVRRHTGPLRAALLSAPLATNSYVLGGAMYLTTDNLAYMCVFCTFGVCLRPLSPVRSLAGGAGCVLAVLVRQIHVWSVAPLGIAALLASPLARALPAPWRSHDHSWKAALLAWSGCAVALGVLGAFVAVWGGLTPPADTAAKHASGVNLASPALALALWGVFLPFLAGRELLMALGGAGRRWMLGGAVAGLLAGVAAPTSFELKHRAYGWMWTVVQHTPTIGDRSLVLGALAIAGGAAIGGLAFLAVKQGRLREVVVLGVGVSAWLAAQSMNSMAWQRYYEPMTLAIAAWLAALAWAGAPRPLSERALAYFGPAALALLMLGVSAATLVREVLNAPPVNF